MKKLRALIIEDNDDDAQLLLRHLRGTYDLEYERVDTADAARFALTNQAWEIVLSDYQMPTFSAPAALEIVKELNLGIPFIIISGTIGEETAVQGTGGVSHPRAGTGWCRVRERQGSPPEGQRF